MCSCSQSAAVAESTPEETTEAPASDDPAYSAVNFEHELDSYKPQKDHYNFYFTYKTVHTWWDAVALGMEEAQRQYLDKGVTITYEYMAPDQASAEDQTLRLRDAEKKNYDVIGVDVADEQIISPILDEMIDSGTKVMTFSGSDAAEGCKRLAYVGNTHNYEDGCDLTEALCEKLEYKGKNAILVMNRFALVDEDNIVYTRYTTYTGGSRHAFLAKDRLSGREISIVSPYGSSRQLCLAIPTPDLVIMGKRYKACFVQFDINDIVNLVALDNQGRTHFALYSGSGSNLSGTELGPMISNHNFSMQ